MSDEIGKIRPVRAYGQNEKVIKCLSVCLYFLSIGDWIFLFHFSFKVVYFF